MKSGSGGTISPDDRDPKRKRLENGSEDFGENRATEMSLSYPTSSDRSSENDVISSENDVISSRNDVISSRDSEARDKSRSGVVKCPAHGSISLIGRRREMEDAVAVELGFLNKDSAGFDFYGVYDGHGGSCVAHACRDRLHRLLVEEMEEETTSLDWEKVMVGCFGKMDEEVNRSGRVLGAEGDSATVGSTAVVAVVGEEEVVVANCGDSRAVMSRGGVVVFMSSDHKVNSINRLALDRKGPKTSFSPFRDSNYKYSNGINDFSLITNLLLKEGLCHTSHD